MYNRCKTNFSPNTGTFFSANGSKRPAQNLTIKKIMKILYNWAFDLTILGASEVVGVSNPTASLWFKKIRSVCSRSFEDRQKFGGEGYIVEIDECLLHGKRKNNRGRYLKGDAWKTSQNKEFLLSSRHKYHFLFILFNYCKSTANEDLSGSEYIPSEVEFVDESFDSNIYFLVQL